MNQRLRINLLGSPEIWLGEQRLTFATRKALALLIYLICERGAQRRERLATLFWPAADQERGRVSLRRALAYLRQGLGDEPALLVDSAVLAFNFALAHELDLTTLQTALVQMPVNRLPSEERKIAIAQLQAVAEQVRGEFLAGFGLEDAPEFETWLQIERERWQRQLCVLLDRLSDWQLADGDWRAALTNAQQWQRFALLDEAAYRRQMQAYLASGDQGAAQAVYAVCCSILARELNVTPTPETVALATQLQPTITQSQQPRSTRQPAGDLHPVLETPLIGRGREFGALVANYQRLRTSQLETGRIAICVVEGEAGMGKTRLCEAFLDWAAQQGADVLRGRAFEAGGRVLYQPVVEALQNRLSHENAPDDLLSDLWLSELSRLLPDLHERYPDLAQPLSLSLAGGEAEAQTRLFEAVTRLGEALAARNPLIWLVDDLQWADHASLDLLRFVARRWTQTGTAILLLFTVRSEALTVDTALREWLVGIGRDLPLQHVAVTPLNAAQTHEMVLALAGAPTLLADQSEPLRDFSRWLHHETNGQPFFLSEMFKALAEQQWLQLTVAGDKVVLDFSPALANLPRLTGFMPASVRQVLRARLARLSPAASTLLSAGAVLGQRLGFEQMSTVAGLNETESLQALDELLAAQLLREEKASNTFADQPYLFTHDKIRTVVYEEAGSARRRVLHRRAFGCLQQANAAAAELSHHATLAGLLQPAFDCNIRAGDEALRLFALSTAISHYRQAQTLLHEQALSSLTEQPSEQFLHLHLQLGRAYDLNNEWEAARTVYDELLTMARQQSWFTAECSALNRLASLLTWNAQAHDQAIALLDAARQLAEKHGDGAGLAETIWNLAQLHMYLDQPEALTYGEEAVALARQLDSPFLLARSLNALAHAYQNYGRWAEIIVIADEARQLYAQLGDKALEAEQYTLLALEYCNLGQLAQSIAAGRKALAITEAIDNHWGQAFAAFALAVVLQESGQVDEALLMAQHSIDLITPLHVPPLQIVALAALGMTQIALGRLEEASVTLTDAEAMNRANGNMAGNREMLASYRCLIALQQQNWHEAHRYAVEASQSRGAERSLSASLPRWSEIAALLYAGDTKLAHEELQRLGRWAESSPRLQLSYQQAQIVMLNYAGKPVEAEVMRLVALKLAEQMGLPQAKAQLMTR